MTGYTEVYSGLTPQRIARAIWSIQNSEGLFELDDCSHIISDSGRRAGYIGDDSLQLVDQGDMSLEADHGLLKKLFESIWSG